MWPGWLSPSLDAVTDLLMLAGLRFDLLRERQTAGVIETVSWIVGTSPGPATGRGEGPRAREVALCELCAAECLAVEDTGAASPPLRQVCDQLGVRYVPARSGDPGFGVGVRETLRWALGETPRPPLRLPLRGADGRVLAEEPILASLLGSGMNPAEAAAAAREMAADSRRLAELVRVWAGVRV